MKPTNKLLGFCLVLAVLFAPAAQAATFTFNPGSVGDPAGDIPSFFVDLPGAAVIDLVWTDNKTLEWGSGTHNFVFAGAPNQIYTGFLLDADLNSIPGTEITGTMPSSLDPFAFGFVDLAQPTVFSGMRFVASFPSDIYTLAWDDQDRPTVGVVPLPAAVWLLGGGLIGLLGLRRKFNK